MIDNATTTMPVTSWIRRGACGQPGSRRRLPASARRPAAAAVAAGHTQLRVERALAALPAAQREVVVLVALEGLSTAEVARATASTEVAIRQRLSRARAAIAAALVEHSPKGGPHDR